MTTTITRLYRHADHAAAAVRQLSKYGFATDAIHVVDVTRIAITDSPPRAVSMEDVVAALMKGYILRAHARVYAATVIQGASAVTVHAPFGTARRALFVLDSYAPLDVVINDPRETSALAPWDEAAPLSSIFNLPLLSKDPTPFASFFGLPTLTHSKAHQPWHRGPLLDSKFLLFESIGIRSLTRNQRGKASLSQNPSPLSSLLGLPVLVKDKPGRPLTALHGTMR